METNQAGNSISDQYRFFLSISVKATAWNDAERPYHSTLKARLIRSFLLWILLLTIFLLPKACGLRHITTMKGAFQRMTENKSPNQFQPTLTADPECGNPADARQTVPDNKPAAPAKKQETQPKEKTVTHTHTEQAILTTTSLIKKFWNIRAVRTGKLVTRN